MANPEIPIKKLHADAVVPTYATHGDAGADLTSVEHVVIAPGATAIVATGIAMAIPVGYVGLVHPRSGLAAKNGITVLNTPGTIDAGYRGEVKVILINHSASDFVVEPGMRIAQLVIQEVCAATFPLVDDLDETERGAGGFGSTGVQ